MIYAHTHVQHLTALSAPSPIMLIRRLCGTLRLMGAGSQSYLLLIAAVAVVVALSK